MPHEALFYKTLEKKAVECQLCPHNCRISDGKAGICRGRRNNNGKLIAETYGKCVSISVDPIEKKPLFHFFPGEGTLSICTAGCNMRCKFCQNWEISQKGPGDLPFQELSPEQIVDAALSKSLHHISCTYTEPTIYYEYAYDTCKLAHSKGIHTSWVSNGFIEEEPLRQLIPVLDAMNMDFKMANSKDYKKYCLADAFEVAKRTLKTCHEAGVHIEVTTLVVPGLNDDLKELEENFKYIASISKSIPLHISRFHPDYEMRDGEATPLATLEKAAKAARNHLDFVYIGNAPSGGEDTSCPKCGALLIKRRMFSILENNLDGCACSKCGAELNFVRETS